MNHSSGVRSAAELLGDAAQWHLLSLLLLRPTEARKDEVRELLGDAATARLAEVARAWCAHADEASYLQAFGPGGAVSPRAVAYRPFSDPGWVLAEIGRYHRAFGFVAVAEEPPDHIAVLADFVAYLFLKEVFGAEGGGELARIARRARERFVEEHLVPVAARVADRAATQAEVWATAVRLLADRVPASPNSVESRESLDEDWRCGSCAGP